jgi:hypothetical protein
MNIIVVSNYIKIIAEAPQSERFDRQAGFPIHASISEASSKSTHDNVTVSVKTRVPTSRELENSVRMWQASRMHLALVH